MGNKISSIGKNIFNKLQYIKILNILNNDYLLKNNSLEDIKKLLLTFDTNICNENGKNLLHTYAYRNNYELLKLFLDNGCNINKQDNLGTAGAVVAVGAAPEELVDEADALDEPMGVGVEDAVGVGSEEAVAEPAEPGPGGHHRRVRRAAAGGGAGGRQQQRELHAVGDL